MLTTKVPTYVALTATEWLPSASAGKRRPTVRIPLLAASTRAVLPLARFQPSGARPKRPWRMSPSWVVQADDTRAVPNVIQHPKLLVREGTVSDHSSFGLALAV